ncbi:polysaccharide deacetylase family protein [Paenibacillus sp. JX-17]|uniref:Polysaccharide deacetylase family protein n=1 Tax=Paenibacillus lacisoli TaxID=3064525 RepID=A0ABT9CFA4_9BACL|nr:polysaccharide deacetylase family protein [Paenibacillus sp. JX-17]MDO7907956.1 polysaccharide deacetylase family protein [Paenibacillus sp. JX-17]
MDNHTLITNNVSTSRKAIALTFDDGPDPVYTPQIQHILAAHQAKATFFVIGERLEAYAAIAESLHLEEHELGNHTFTHPNMTELDAAACRAEIRSTEDQISAITGKCPTSFRAPYLAMDPQVHQVACEMGYKIIGASNTGTDDWAEPGVEHIIKYSLNGVENGSILLLHDSGGDRSQTVEAVRVLVPELISRGYELVTVSDLLQR